LRLLLLEDSHYTDVMTVRRYTVLCEFRGGTYVSQVSGSDVHEAVKSWTDYLARDRPIPQYSTNLAKAIAAQAEDTAPAALEGLAGVWRVSAVCGGDLILANIVETAQAVNGS
jgi:hypothetical protein